MNIFEACDVLEVRVDDDMEEIKKVYLSKVRKTHPDIADDKDKNQAEETTKQLNSAYDVICEYRNQPVSSEELFASIFSAFERVISERHGNSVDGFIIHVDMDRDPVWRTEEEQFWTVE